MSKSLGNVVDPAKVIQQMGADILRLWVSSADYRGDLQPPGHPQADDGGLPENQEHLPFPAGQPL